MDFKSIEIETRLANCQRQRDALAEALRNCIPTLEDVAQNQKNMVDFGIVEPGFIQMATRTRDLIEKTMAYIQNALAMLDE